MHMTTLKRLAVLSATLVVATGALANPNTINYMEHPGRIAQIDFPARRAGSGDVARRFVDVYDVAIRGIEGFAALGPDGLIVFSIFGPIGDYIGGPAYSVTTKSVDCVWIGQDGAVTRLNTTDPTNPTPAGTTDIPGAGVIVEMWSTASMLFVRDELDQVFRLTLSAPCGSVTAVDAVPQSFSGLVGGDLNGTTGALINSFGLVVVDLSTTPPTSTATSVPPGGGNRTVVVSHDQQSVIVANGDGLHVLGTFPPLPIDQNTERTNVQKITRGPNDTYVSHESSTLGRWISTDTDDWFRFGQVSAPEDVVDIATDGAVAALRGGSNPGVTLYRLGNGMSPPVLQRIADPFMVPDAIVRDDDRNLVLISHAGGMSPGSVELYDTTDPCAFTPVGQFTGRRVISLDRKWRQGAQRAQGDPVPSFALMGGPLGFEILDYTDAMNPQVVGSIPASSSVVAAADDRDIALRSNQSPMLGFFLVDISDPMTPFDRGFVSTPNGVNDALIDGPFAVVATTGLTGRWDVSDPDAPVLDHATTFTGVRSVASSSASDQYYLGGTANDDRRVVRYDFGTQMELSSVSVGARSLSVVSSPASLLGGREIVYAGDANGATYVIDWTDAADPLLLGEYSEEGLTMKQVVATDETVIVTNGSFPGDVIVLPAQDTMITTSTPGGFEPVVPLFGKSWPNPFRTTTTLAFTLDRRSDVRLDVFDVSGRRVRELAVRAFTAGQHTLQWDGRDAGGHALPSGTYFVRLEAGTRVDRRKVKLLR